MDSMMFQPHVKLTRYVPPSPPEAMSQGGNNAMSSLSLDSESAPLSPSKEIIVINHPGFQQKAEKKFPCEICLKPFAHEYNAKGHVYTHMSREELAETWIFYEDCEFCGRIFFNGRSYMRHLRTHNPPIPPPQPENPENDETNEIIIQEPLIQLSSQLVSKYICYFCNKSFKLHQGLQRHFVTHTKETPFKCSNCAKQFPTFSNKHQHEKLCGGSSKNLIGQHLCYFCSKNFQGLSNLVRHLVTHTKEAPFKCPACKMKFTQKSNLKRHTETHRADGGRKFPCSFCPSKFTQKSTRKRHEQNIHKSPPGPTLLKIDKRNPQKLAKDKNVFTDKKFKCRECGWKFQAEKELKLHRNNKACENNKILVIKCIDFKTQSESVSKLLSKYKINRQEINSSSQADNEKFENNEIIAEESDETGIDPEEFIQVESSPLPESFEPEEINPTAQNSTIRQHSQELPNEQSENDDGSRSHKTGKTEPPPSPEVFQNGNKNRHERKCGRSSKKLNPRFSKCDGRINYENRVHSNVNKRDDMKSIKTPTNPPPPINNHQMPPTINELNLDINPLNQYVNGNDVVVLPSSISTVRKVISARENKGKSSIRQHPYDNSCYFCSKTFAKLHKLNRHLITHIKEAPFKCSTCKKEFALPDNLKRHEKLHGADGGKKFPCDFCPLKFAQKANKIKHESFIHLKIQGEGKNRCYFCGIKCIGLVHLNRHLAIHTLETPYKCNKCQKEFKRAYHLKEHLKTHDKDKLKRITITSKNFKCGDCGWKFQTGKELKLHQIWKACSNNKILGIKCIDLKTQDARIPKVKFQSKINKKETNSPPEESKQPENNEIISEASQADLEEFIEIETHSQQRALEGDEMDPTAQNYAEGNSPEPCSKQSANVDTNRPHKTKLPVSTEPKNDDITPQETSLTHFDHPGEAEPSPQKVPQNDEMSPIGHGAMKQSQTQAILETELEKDRIFPQESTLTQASAQSGSKHVCYFCNKDLKLPSSLQQHLFTHTKETPFKCSHCSQQFSCNRNKNRHERKCGGAREKFHCSFCPSSFTSYVQKLYHECKVHLNLKIVKQHQTPTGLTQLIKEQLNVNRNNPTKNQKPILPKSVEEEQLKIVAENHLANGNLVTNKKEAPFKCPSCKKGFTIMSNLRRHAKLHGAVGGRKFPCGFCSLQFTQKVHTIKHEKRVHLKTNVQVKDKINRQETPPVLQTENDEIDPIIQNAAESQHSPEIPNEQPENDEVITEKSLNRDRDPEEYIRIDVPPLPQTFQNDEVSVDATAQNSAEGQNSPKVPHEQFENDDTNRLDEILPSPAGHAEPPPPEVQNDDCIIQGTMKQFQNSQEMTETDDLILRNSTILQKSPKFVLGPKHACYFCKKSFKLPQGLRQHLVTHTKETPFKCSHCPKQFNANSNKHQHERNCVGNGNKFRSIFTKNDDLQNAEKDDTIRPHEINGRSPVPPPIKCSVCNQQFTLKSSLDRHEKSHGADGGRSFPCSFCSSRFTRKANKIIHEKKCNLKYRNCKKNLHRETAIEMRNNNSSPRHSCYFCSKNFSRPEYLNRHLATHTKETPLKCHTCKKEFALKGSFKRHIDLHEADGGRKFLCSFCPLKFAQKGTRITHEKNIHFKNISDLKLLKLIPKNAKTQLPTTAPKMHIKAHDKDRNFKCGDCGWKFQTGGELKLHQIWKACKSKIPVIKCIDLKTQSSSVPKVQIKDKSNRNAINSTPPPSKEQFKDMAKNLLKSRHLCYFCFKSFPKLSQLNRHLVVHTKETPFKCPTCKKEYTLLDSLKSHERLHGVDGGKTFQCGSCPVKFTWNSNRIRHERNHLKSYVRGLEKHFCYFCGIKCSGRVQLNGHLTTHTLETPYKCGACKKQYNWVWNFKRHLKTHAE